MILGLGESSFLSPSLCSRLDSLNCSTLALVNVPRGVISLPDCWLERNDLLLDGLLATECNCYTTALKRAGISLIDSSDSLLWAGGDASGTVSVKNLYVALINQQQLITDLSWKRRIWEWGIPIKLKLFIWLAGTVKLLTWDVLNRRGWEGHGLCLLCRHSSEDVSHLLVHCHFTKEVWKCLVSHFSVMATWSGSNLSDCFTC